jgi:ribonuclease HI
MRVYTDGSCIRNGKLDALCGSGVWVEEGHPMNKAIRIPGERQSNQVGEIAAAIVAAETLPNYCKLTIVTDSRYVIDGLTKHLREWEDNGWIGVENAELFKRAAYLLKRRSAPTCLEWVKGHQGDRGNEESDKLAKEGANKNEPDALSLQIPAEFDLQGAKLATLTQAIAYRGIRNQRKSLPRPIAVRNIDRAREAIRRQTGSNETNGTIWKSIRKRTICLRVQQFLYKAIHSTQMIGDTWLHIPGYERRGYCGPCATIESMSHILFICGAGPVTAVWSLAKNLWPYNEVQWPDLNLGTILGCGCLVAKLDEPDRQNGRGRGTSNRQRGASRLLQILVSEAAHLIWVLRCERVIQEKQHTYEEIESRWYKAINRRLTDDKITATIIKRDEPFTRLVEATWEEALNKISNPPDEWIHHREVLVGRSGTIRVRCRSH